MKHVILSSSESELVAMSECVHQVCYEDHGRSWLGIEAPCHSESRQCGCNVSCRDETNTQRTRHIDIRYKWVSEFIENRDVEIVFVKTAENDADIFTKNGSGDLNKRHIKQMMHLEE